MANPSAHTDVETSQQHFERVLSREPFTGLKAIFDKLSVNRAALCDAVNGANSYADLLMKLGYRINLIPQIHVNDAYTRVGPAGGIKAVIPYHDIPTYSALPTLVNFDSTVTTTSKAAGFFNEMLTALKKQLSAQE